MWVRTGAFGGTSNIDSNSDAAPGPASLSDLVSVRLKRVRTRPCLTRGRLNCCPELGATQTRRRRVHEQVHAPSGRTPGPSQHQLISQLAALGAGPLGSVCPVLEGSGKNTTPLASILSPGGRSDPVGPRRRGARSAVETDRDQTEPAPLDPPGHRFSRTRLK